MGILYIMQTKNALEFRQNYTTLAGLLDKHAPLRLQRVNQITGTTVNVAVPKALDTPARTEVPTSAYR